MANGNKDYFGLDYLVSLILAIFTPTCWILGILTRIKEGNLVAAIVRIFLGFNVIWILDIIYMVLNRAICRIL